MQTCRNGHAAGVEAPPCAACLMNFSVWTERELNVFFPLILTQMKLLYQQGETVRENPAFF